MEVGKNSRSSAKKIAIIGATIHGNHGAEAMLEATIGRLKNKHEDINFSIYSYYADVDRELNGLDNLVFHSATPMYLVVVLFPFSIILGLLRVLGLGSLGRFFPESVNDLANSDILIDLAGVSYIDGREIYLPFNILTILPAMLLGTPVIKFSQAMGPFRNPINRFFAKIMLGRCARVFARGAITADNLSQLDGEVSWERADDIAFLFANQHALTLSGRPVGENILAQIAKQKLAGKQVVGICPSSVIAGKSGEDYLKLIKRLVEHLSSIGMGVILFPNATRSDRMDKLFNNDLPILRSISDSLDGSVKESVILVEEDLYAPEIKAIITECSLVVVSRFHAMVLALSVEVPPLVVGWSHKYMEVMKLFELEDNVADYLSVDGGSLNKSADEAFHSLEDMRQKIRTHLPAVLERAQIQVDYASGLVE